MYVKSTDFCTFIEILYSLKIRNSVHSTKTSTKSGEQPLLWGKSRFTESNVLSVDSGGCLVP